MAGQSARTFSDVNSERRNLGSGGAVWHTVATHPTDIARCRRTLRNPSQPNLVVFSSAATLIIGPALTRPDRANATCLPLTGRPVEKMPPPQGASEPRTLDLMLERPIAHPNPLIRGLPRHPFTPATGDMPRGTARSHQPDRIPPFSPACMSGVVAPNHRKTTPVFVRTWSPRLARRVCLGDARVSGRSLRRRRSSGVGRCGFLRFGFQENHSISALHSTPRRSITKSDGVPTRTPMTKPTSCPPFGCLGMGIDADVAGT